MITATTLLPAVCATRANFHAGGYLVLNDLHTGRVRGLLIEIATSPHTGTTILQIRDPEQDARHASPRTSSFVSRWIAVGTPFGGRL